MLRISHKIKPYRVLKRLTEVPFYSFINLFDPHKSAPILGPPQIPPVSGNVFVSDHYVIPNEEITGFFDSNGVIFKQRPSGQFVTKFCPFCPKHHHEQLDNMWTLNIKPNSGAFFCFRCGSKGSWIDFKNSILGDASQYIGSMGNRPIQTQGTRRNPQEESSKFPSEPIGFLRFKALENETYPESLRYLTSKENNECRHLSKETLMLYKVGLGEETFLNVDGNPLVLPVVYFPMFFPKSKKQTKTRKSSKKEAKNESGDSVPPQVKSISDEDYQLARYKIRAIGKENKHFQRLEPVGGHWGVFGMNTVPPDADVVVITEGEYDAMAVHQASGLAAVSLPNGATNLPLNILPMFEHFKRIYLWMDADEVGQANASAFAQKLGIHRTFLVKSPVAKDANDALRLDPELIEEAIKEGRPITQENLVTFSELKKDVITKLLNYEDGIGVRSRYFGWFNKKVKGLRRGELSIMTGGTGSGKTTLLSQMSIDFAHKGMGTLWGSFEIRNEVLAASMLTQFSGTNLLHKENEILFHSERFEKVPIHFMKFFGSTEFEKILNTIEYAIYAYDIGHVIIDNLQFFLSGQGRGIEKFDLQDKVVAQLRALATNRNIHITLVIHPRKSDEVSDLTISSVFGGAKATQEADNIFILQNRPKYRIIEVRKNRFDGELGKIPLGFNKENKQFLELSEEEVFQLHRTNISIEDVMARRKNTGQTTGLRLEVEGENQDKLRMRNGFDEKLLESLFEEERLKMMRRNLMVENPELYYKLYGQMKESEPQVIPPKKEIHTMANESGVEEKQMSLDRLRETSKKYEQESPKKESERNQEKSERKDKNNDENSIAMEMEGINEINQALEDLMGVGIDAPDEINENLFNGTTFNPAGGMGHSELEMDLAQGNENLAEGSEDLNGTTTQNEKTMASSFPSNQDFEHGSSASQPVPEFQAEKGSSDEFFSYIFGSEKMTSGRQNGLETNKMPNFYEKTDSVMSYSQIKNEISRKKTNKFKSRQYAEPKTEGSDDDELLMELLLDSKVNKK